jgi:hypothetical protein
MDKPLAFWNILPFQLSYALVKEQQESEPWLAWVLLFTHLQTLGAFAFRLKFKKMIARICILHRRCL